MQHLNETHDPALRSWVASAQAADTEFPMQNLPLAVFRRRDSREAFRGGVAIGEQIVDLAAAVERGVFGADSAEAARAAYVEIPGAGHVPFWEDPATFNTALTAALDRLSGSPFALWGVRPTNAAY